MAPVITLTRGPLTKLCTISADVGGSVHWWDLEFDDLLDLYEQLKYRSVPTEIRAAVLRKACRQAEGLR